MKECGVSIDHTTIGRWVIKYAPSLEGEFRKKHKRQTDLNWHIDETCLKNRGK
jgi:putative transposase